MNSLRELQATCYQAFTGNDAAMLLPSVRDNGIAPEQRVEVYRNNYRRDFRERPLLASFPVIERLVGEACLAGLAHQYTQAHPSRCGDIQRFGAAFPAFLDRTYGDTRFRYLSGVAALEWALEEVHVERDEPPLAISELGRFHGEDLGNLVFSDRRAGAPLAVAIPGTFHLACQSARKLRTGRSGFGRRECRRHQAGQRPADALARRGRLLAGLGTDPRRPPGRCLAAERPGIRGRKPLGPHRILQRHCKPSWLWGCFPGCPLRARHLSIRDRGSSIWKQPSST